MVKKDVFMSICPRNKDYIGYNVQGIPLRVVRSGGVNVQPHIKFSSVDLNTGGKFFHNNTGQADSFTITVLLNEKDVCDSIIDWTNNTTVNVNSPEFQRLPRNLQDELMHKNLKVIDVLDYFIRKGEPFYVTTHAVGIDSNDLWLVTKQDSRKQTHDDGYTTWNLTFTKYVPTPIITYQNTNKAVKKAIKKYKKAKDKKKAEKAKSKTTVKDKLKTKCTVKVLVYSKTQKEVKCVKYLQKILTKHGFYKGKIDGWYGKLTVEAVKAFQKKYKKKYGLKTNGKVDKSTFKALYTV